MGINYANSSLGVCGVLVGSLWNSVPSRWEFVEFGASCRWEFVAFSLGVCGIYPKNAVSDSKCTAPLMMHHFFFYLVKKICINRAKGVSGRRHLKGTCNESMGRLQLWAGRAR